jgi:hypothetical protein
MIEITVLIAVCGFAISAATFFIGRMTAARSSGTADGEMKASVSIITSFIGC